MIFICHNLIYSQAIPANTVIDGNYSTGEAALLLSEYLQQESITGNEKSAGEFLASKCKERGLNVKVFSDKTNSYNFAASLYPLELGKPNIILLNHIDVVQPGDLSEWEHPPFSGSIVNDTIWGRGSIDMKGIAIMQLLAASTYTDTAMVADLPYNVTLLSVSGEENFGKLGSKIISENFLEQLNPVAVLGEGGVGIKNIISSEPEKLVYFVSVSDKRALWLRLDLTQESSGHGSVPPNKYANKMMISSLNSLSRGRQKIKFNQETIRMFKSFGKMENGLKGCFLRHPLLFKPIIASQVRKDPLLLSTVVNTMTITKFDYQDNDINQIPQDISVFLDCRLIPETSTEDFIEEIRAKLNNDQIEITVIQETQKASPTIPGNYFDLIKGALEETYPGAGVMPIMFPATTDNNYFRNKGIPVYGLVPVYLNKELIKTAHNYNERLPVEAIVKGAEVFTRFLEKLLLNNDD